MNNINIQTEWTEADTKIIERYEQRVKEGNIKKFVIVPLDNN